MFVGGTSGVGEGTLRAFAQAAQGRAHIVIVGRDSTRAEEIIASFPKTDESQYDFIQCDATLLKNVVIAANEAKSKISGSLNYLVFVDELLPLLDKAARSGQDARVMSIMDPKNARLLDVEDFGVKKKYSLTQSAQQIGAYNSAMVQEYSPIHPNLSFSHIYPGLVKTRVARDAPWYVKPVISGLLLLGKTSEECGEWMFSALINDKYKTGGWLIGEFGEELDVQRDSPENRALLLDHYRKQVTEATKA
ncbi:hypothetical protein FRC01_009448 [Tulasnella sp. 417]|nr:hypothetical protein FRC01_009448 [Tulasnella sp. 417]